MSKLKIACLLLGITMLLSIIFFQFIKPLPSLEGWENVNMEMSNTIQLESRTHVTETPKQQSDQPVLSQAQKDIEAGNFGKMESETESLSKIGAQEIPTNSIINLNSATLEQLDILPGIGPSKAMAIMEYRTKYGEFRSLEQIMEVKGIGPKVFEKMKERITITKAP